MSKSLEDYFIKGYLSPRLGDSVPVPDAAKEAFLIDLFETGYGDETEKAFNRKKGKRTFYIF
jgi:hypothetical protein